MYFRVTAVLAVLCAGAQGGETERVRTAAAKAIALMEKTNANWNVPCLSCHNQAMAGISFSVAREHGLPVDEQAAKKHIGKVFGPYYSDFDSVIQGLQIIDPGMAESYALIAAAHSGIRNASTRASAIRLANWQFEDGHWTALDGRPPSSGSYFTTTALSAHAVDLQLPESLASLRERVKTRAREWLAAQRPEAVEDRAFHLLGLAWTGAPEEQRKANAAALVRQQSADGGWGQLPGLSSDAYSTAQALFALADGGGVAANDPAWQKGVQWLVSNQAADGSWHVQSWIDTPAKISPPYFESGYPYGHDQYLSMAASGWAVMALARALPKAASPASPLPLPEAEPKALPAWVETAMHGSTEALRRLLDAGLDPNAATTQGTSVLMVAAHDEAKVQLLLERGARAGHAAKSKITVIMAATTYRGNAPVLRRLLDAGASAKPVAGSKLNFSPMVMAALTGDVAAATLLADKGAALSPTMLLGGFVSLKPLVAAALTENLDVMRFLVSRGVSADELDSERLTTLSNTLLAHKVESSKVLVDLGAKLDYLDPLGWKARQHVLGIQYPPAELLRLAGKVERPAPKPKPAAKPKAD